MNETNQEETITIKNGKKVKKRTNQNDLNKKRKKIKKWAKNSIVDKNKLTMFDLISYNPPANDKLNENDEEKSNDDQNSNVENDSNDNSKETITTDQQQPKANEEIEKEHNSESEENEDESIGPRVKINENGEIVLDEASLIVKRKKPKDQDIKTVYEDDKTLSTRTNYSSFKKPGKTNEKKLRWTDDETVKFYTALNIIGTDFTLMSELFFRDQRSRVDLKNKFKQEEKCHKVLIDNALKKSDLTSIHNLENINILDLFSSDDSDVENSKTADKPTKEQTNELTSTASETS